MAERAGLKVAGCHVDRAKKGSIAALVLWPLIALVSAVARRGMVRNNPVAVRENAAHLSRVNSLAILTGRTVILELVRA